MKQYKVLKDLISAPVGTILRDCDNGVNTLYLVDNSSNIGRIIDGSQFERAIKQGFIEPYTPEPKRWRAEKGVRFWFVSEIGDVYSFTDKNDENEYYDLGNYFKSQATAELVAKAKKLFFEWLHTNKNIELEADWLYATNEARKACIEDDSNEDE